MRTIFSFCLATWLVTCFCFTSASAQMPAPPTSQDKAAQEKYQADKAAWVKAHPAEYAQQGTAKQVAGNSSTPQLVSATPKVQKTTPVATRNGKTAASTSATQAKPKTVEPLTGPVDEIDEEIFKTYSAEKKKHVLDHPEKYKVVKNTGDPKYSPTN